MGNFKNVGIIGDALAPRFNEAQANQMRLLAEKYDIPVLTCNSIGLKPFKRMGRYMIVNGHFLREGTYKPGLSILNGAFFYLFLKYFENRHDTLILSGSINSGFLRHLRLNKCVLIINSLPYSIEDPEARKFTSRYATKLKGIIAQSDKVKDKVLALGATEAKVKKVYPWVDLDRFQVSSPPPLDEFRILFASAPNTPADKKSVFEDKGINLLLKAFSSFSHQHKARLYIIWRGYHTAELEQKIAELKVNSSVEVINHIVDMPALFAKSHMLIVPYRNTLRSPEIPLSAVESLACGRPVIATDVAEIAEIVYENHCGISVPPDSSKIAGALSELLKNYINYQQNCRITAEKLFGMNMSNLLSGYL